jgi:hypothetical protein
VLDASVVKRPRDKSIESIFGQEEAFKFLISTTIRKSMGVFAKLFKP